MKETGRYYDVRGRIQIRDPNMKQKDVTSWPSFYVTNAVEWFYFHLDGVDLKVRNVVIFFTL